MDADSKVLAERARKGDDGALNMLLERHLPGLRAYIRLRAARELRTRESDADLAQSVCREALEEMGGFRYRGEAAFRSWLYTLALRKIIDRVRYYHRAKRDINREVALPAMNDQEAQDLLECYGSFCTPSQGAVAREELSRIEQAFEQLPDDYREVLVLSRIVGMSRSEIAEQMQRSEEAVRKLLSRALLSLSKILGQDL